MQIVVMAALVVSLAGPAQGAADGRVAVGAGELLQVQASGHGPTLVLIPGLLGTAYGFRKVVGPLEAAGYRVLVVEPLGIGRSSRPREADYSLTAQADRVGAVLDALGAGPAVLVAHAVGASIALRLAYRRPDRVAAIVSLDGGPAEQAGTRGFRRALRFAPLLRLFGLGGRIRAQVRATLVERSADPRWVTDDVVDGYLGAASQDLGDALRAYGQIARAREPEALAPHLPAIRCPVRLVIGTATREGGISAAEIEALRGALPSFALETVAGAGHFVFEEKPMAVVAAVEHTVGPLPRAARGGAAR